jgi:hypothetical protein
MEMTGANIPRILGCHREGGEMPPSLMLANDPVLVVPYEDEWPLLFREQAAQMRAAMGEVALRIDHIGSTSVPGLAAKPVIDVSGRTIPVASTVSGVAPDQGLLGPQQFCQGTGALTPSRRARWHAFF